MTPSPFGMAFDQPANPRRIRFWAKQDHGAFHRKVVPLIQQYIVAQYHAIERGISGRLEFQVQQVRAGFVIDFQDEIGLRGYGCQISADHLDRRCTKPEEV